MSVNTSSFSLADLDEDTEETIITPIQSGDGTPKPENLEQVIEDNLEDLENEEEEEIIEEEEEPEEEETPKPTVPTTPEEEKPKEEEDTAEAVEFLETLSTELGQNITDLEVDFEGVDPLTPAGISKVITAVSDKQLSDYDDHLKTKYPDAYALFLANQAGISTEDYYANQEKGLANIPTADALAESDTLQRELVKSDLIAKGLKEGVIAHVLKQYEDDDVLLEESLKIHGEKVAGRDAKMKELNDLAEQKAAADQATLQVLNTGLNTVLTSGIIAKGLIIPKAERAEAIQTFKESLRFEGGKLVQVIEIDPSEVAKALGRNYIGNKGSIDKIVETKAKTLNTVRLKNAVKDDSKNKTAQKAKNRGTTLTLGELEDE